MRSLARTGLPLQPADVSSRTDRLRTLSRCVLALVAPVGNLVLHLLYAGTMLYGLVIPHIITCSLGLLVAPAYFLFFTLVSTKRRGVLFGLGLGAGIAVRIVVRLATDAPVGPGGMHDRFWLLYRVLLVLFALLSAAMLLGVLRPPLPSPQSSLLDSGIVGARKRVLGKKLLAAALLFYVVNGFVSARLFPFLTLDAHNQLQALPVVLAVFSPFVGWLLDRDLATWLRRYLPWCAVVFMLSPTLLILDGAPRTFQLVHTISVLGQFALFIGVTLAMDYLTEGGKWNCPATCAPYLLRIVSVPGMLLSNSLRNEHLGPLAVVSTLAAIAFYHIVKSITDAKPLKAVAAALAEPPVPEVAPDAPAPSRPPPASVSPDDFFRGYGLTAREREIAGLMIQGVLSDRIAERLAISKNTVKTHVKGILRKLNLGNRKELMAKFIQEGLDAVNADMDTEGRRESTPAKDGSDATPA